PYHVARARAFCNREQRVVGRVRSFTFGMFARGPRHVGTDHFPIDALVTVIVNAEEMVSTRVQRRGVVLRERQWRRPAPGVVVTGVAARIERHRLDVITLPRTHVETRHAAEL